MKKLFFPLFFCFFLSNPSSLFSQINLNLWTIHFGFGEIKFEDDRLDIGFNKYDPDNNISYITSYPWNITVERQFNQHLIASAFISNHYTTYGIHEGKGIQNLYGKAVYQIKNSNFTFGLMASTRFWGVLSLGLGPNLNFTKSAYSSTTLRRTKFGVAVDLNFRVPKKTWVYFIGSVQYRYAFGQTTTGPFNYEVTQVNYQIPAYHFIDKGLWLTVGVGLRFFIKKATPPNEG